MIHWDEFFTGAAFAAVGLAMMGWVWRRWLSIRDCRDEERWDNGYHFMATFAGFLFILPPMIVGMGLFIAYVSIWGGR